MSAKLHFTFESLSAFPEPAGLKGYYALSSNNQYFLMGGSTFPLPASEGGKKTYYDTIYQLSFTEDSMAHWSRLKQTLPIPLSEGASLQWDDGALIIGGLNNEGAFNQVWRVTKPANSETLKFTPLQPLPTACFNPAATVWKDKVYVAGGHDGDGGLSKFWSLDLKEKDQAWLEMPAWPGPKRFGAILDVLSDGDREYLYLFSGKTESTNPRSQDNYLKDVYRFNPVDQTWQRLHDLPRAALIGIPGKLNPNTLAIFSGSDGHDIDRLDEIGSAYRLPKDILVYDARTDNWMTGGEMPVGLIGVPLLKTDSGFILASGEYSPGLRSDAVYRIRVETAD